MDRNTFQCLGCGHHWEQVGMPESCPACHMTPDGSQPVPDTTAATNLAGKCAACGKPWDSMGHVYAGGMWACAVKAR